MQSYLHYRIVNLDSVIAGELPNYDLSCSTYKSRTQQCYFAGEVDRAVVVKSIKAYSAQTENPAVIISYTIKYSDQSTTASVKK